MHTALVVDDERLARRELRRLIEDGHGQDFRIVGEAATVDEAATLARLHDPDVVFLDIQLGSQSGFDLLPLLDPAITVVFVTAFDSYAIRAFDVNALDYLLKPVAPGRLATTLARLRRPEVAEPADRLDREDRLFLRLGDRMAFLPVREIVAIQASGDNSVLQLAGSKRALARKSLREWADRLPEREFVRIHRSTIVNLAYVDRLEEWSHFTYRVYLRGLAEPLQMSRRYAVRVRTQLG